VARGFLAGLESSFLESGVYNLGSGEAVSISDLIILVQTTLGVRIDVLNQPGRSFDVGSICLDCSKFQQATNWQTTWSLRDGILQLAKFV
jgi:nucleoside-diphosphate-sugar epimerase